MEIAIYVPVLLAAAIGMSARWVAHRLPPSTATMLLTSAAVATAAACSFSLGVMAFLLVARIPMAAALGHWSVGTLRADDHVPLAVSVLAALGSPLVVVLLATVLWRHVRAVLSARDTLARAALKFGSISSAALHSTNASSSDPSRSER